MTMKMLLILIPFAFLTPNAGAQPEVLNQLDSKGEKDGKWTVYYNAKGKKVSDSTLAVYCRYTYYVHGKDCYPFDWCDKNDQIISSAVNKQKLLDGEYHILDKKGNVKSVHVFNKGEYVTYRSFYPSGQLHEYCSFTNQHFSRGEFQPHSYCRRVYNKKGEVKYYYRRNPLTHGPRSFDDSDFDSTAVTNKRAIGDTTFLTVTSFVGNQPRRQADQYFFKQADGDTETRLHGDFTFWYLNGQKKEQGQFDHNRRAGETKYWEKDGTEVKVVPDLNQLNRINEEGEKTGWWITYLDENLKVLEDSVGATHCMYNYCTGKYFHYGFGTWNKLGSKKNPVQFPVSDTLKLNNFNLLNGEYFTYYKSGNVRSVLSASHGILTEWKEYHTNGKLHWRIIYSAACGAPIRVCVTGYDRNGNLKYEGGLMVPQDSRKYRML